MLSEAKTYFEETESPTRRARPWPRYKKYIHFPKQEWHFGLTPSQLRTVFGGKKYLVLVWGNFGL